MSIVRIVRNELLDTMGSVHMTTSTPITLEANPGDFIKIFSIKKFGDGSGYTSRLNVGSGRFSCSGHPFYFDNLNKFTSSITEAHDRVEGKARLGHIFEKDFVEVEVLRGGHVVVTGLIVQHGPSHQELRFAFECDQTFLPQLLQSLKRVRKDLE